MKLAIFGGTFDPIHDAHLAIARLSADRFHLDRVLFVPAARPPHKGGAAFASYEDRVNMVELACAGQPDFEASRLEEGTERSYSIDTIQKVCAQLAPEDELFFIIGADAFAEIQSWRRWEEVTRAVRFIVASRPGHMYEIPHSARVFRLDSLDLLTSSSSIRNELTNGAHPLGLPERVMQYISDNHLYISTR